MRWRKQALLQVLKSHFPNGDLEVAETSVEASTTQNGPHVMNFEFTAAPTRGVTLAGQTAGIVHRFLVCGVDGLQ